MATVANTVKDISRAVADLQETIERSHTLAEYEAAVERVANNVAYVMGKNVALGNLTGPEVAYILASHGFTHDLRTMGAKVAKRVRALRFEHGTMSPQI